MEFVGRAVRKTFPGFGVYSGVVESYDAAAGYFKVLYEDGDSEEVDFGEIGGIVVEIEEEVKPKGKSNRGRKPKKKRRRDGNGDHGIFGENCGSENNYENNYGSSSGVSAENSDFDVRRVGRSENGDLSGKVRGFDLNVSADMECDDFDGSSEDPESLGNCSMDENGQGSKRRRCVSANVGSTSETPLRRSTRRASVSGVSGTRRASVSGVSGRGNEALGSRGVESDFVCEAVPKVELPRSSKDLDLEGLPVLDFFSVYSFLRSFSRVLFLSPFSIQAFLAALRCKNANSLLDAIHFSILQALRQHLNFLSQEGSDSATYCLRSLNWGLLDSATWPVYLFQYLLIRGPKIKSLLVKGTYSRLSNVEYYLLPAGLKIDILCCLCDDILEAETLRSELCSRMTQVDVDVDSWNIITRKRNESLATEVTEETADGNSDECILCGMDGSLICCDGCPAAFHSKCVGIAQDLLPEGDWYCPECLIDRSDCLSKFMKSSRGAEILGTDPHGRLYFSSCGYLLVLDSCEAAASSNFYNKDDLNVLVRMLKLSHASYDIIANTISTCWGINSDMSVSIIQPPATLIDTVEVFNAELDSKKFLTLNQNVMDNHIVEKEPKDSNLSEDGFVGASASDLNQLILINSEQHLGMTAVCEVSEPTGEMTRVMNLANVPEQASVGCATVENPTNEDYSSKSVDFAIQTKKSFEIGGWISKESLVKAGKENILHQQEDPGRYANYYSFGLLAWSVAKELLGKAADNNSKETKSDDDFISRQAKAISKISSNICGYSCLKLSLEVQKEKCRWCYLCRTTGSTECIFILVDGKRLESSKPHLVGLRSEKRRKSHLVYAIQQLLSMEDCLRGFLSGPWDRPNYSSQWRKAVSKASEVTILGRMLLILELNLRRVVLSPDWTKQIDSTNKVGSGFCIMPGPVDLTTSCSGSRKQGRRTLPVVDISSLQPTNASYICWWRGGRLSRQVFHWNTLPQSLALKSARQAGCKKISVLTYPDGPEVPRRSKYVAWRAAVEMSKTLSQLIFQIKEFDSHIRWPELSKTPHFLQLTKESKTFARLFKKVIVRKRRTEGDSMQYLLDFGKRQNIPPIITKYGVMLEEPSCERKKFWLGEPHVPLYLVKSFEERKITRSLKKSATKLLFESSNDCIIEKSKKLKGLSCLMSKAENLDIEVCVQCNEDVLIRDAVFCQECNGLFHREHFGKVKGGLATKYTCFSCNKVTDKLIPKKKKAAKLILEKRKSHKLILKKTEPAKLVFKTRGTDKLILEEKEAGKLVLEKRGSDKLVTKKKGTVESKTSQQKEDSKKNNSCSTLTMVLRKRRKSVLVKYKKRTYGTKQSKKRKTKNTESRKTNTIRNFSMRKRTTRHGVFWLNGFLWSRKPDDKRGESFRNKRVHLPSQNIENTALWPLCCLCLKEYSPELIYVGCENCEDWFHGDIYDLSVENIRFLMGFKCPKCLARSIPSCPFSLQSAISEAKSSTKSTLADKVAHEDRNSEENDEEKTFYGLSAIPVSDSLCREIDDKANKDEEMDVLIAEPEPESYDHLPFVPPNKVENQDSLNQGKDCNVDRDEDMLDVEVLKAESETEGYDFAPLEPPATIQNQLSLDQE